ncbi:Hypothetical_protein [Hexamita inflata]|uniref:Hypothetical_protein n=1 Tax=Hexamita inflata TaxID=28002 RepID=A0AA86V7I4_9EUKA|nr:Hypothetical protein HINF_LOCUS46143 [Hexamita inflata]
MQIQALFRIYTCSCFVLQINISSIFSLIRQICSLSNLDSDIYHIGSSDRLMVDLYPLEDGEWIDFKKARILHASFYRTRRALGTSSSLGLLNSLKASVGILVLQTGS